MPRTKPDHVAPRISEQTSQFFRDNFRTLNFGAEFVLEAWGPLYRRTLADLRGKFTRGELLLMVDSFNSTFLAPVMAGQHIQIQVEDSIDLDHLDKKWEVSRADLVAKIEALPIFSRAVLELWANGYWYGHQDDRELEKLSETILFLEEYIKSML